MTLVCETKNQVEVALCSSSVICFTVVCLLCSCRYESLGEPISKKEVIKMGADQLPWSAVIIKLEEITTKLMISYYTVQ